MAKKKKIFHKVKNVSKPKKVEEKLNPFELKINRKKHDILGQKIKTNRGTITKNKLKINETRRVFLKKVQLHRNKANGFIDKRIGEYDSDMQKEDRVMARIAANQRKKQKKRLYNLNDDFDLTHDGVPISNLETFEDPADESDDEDEAQLKEDFVSEAHFGGFLTKKEDNVPKTRKEILNELIHESKKKKQERKEAKEMTDDLTLKLDEEWKQIHCLLPDIKTNDKNPPSDAYDITVKELKFEPRGKAIVHVKNEELERQKMMKKLEEDRQLRMKDDNLTKKKEENISADALDENFVLYSEPFNEEDAKNIENGNEEIQSTSSLSNDEDEDSNSDSEIDEEENLSNDIAINENIVEDNSLIPQTLSDFLNSISGLQSEELTLKLDSIVSNCNFKADSENFQKSLDFFKLLLEFIYSKFSKNCEDQQLLDVLMTRVIVLAKKSSFETGKIVRSVLLEKIKLYEKLASHKQFNFFGILILLKLCGCLYSTSDFRHPVITPSMTLMSEMLSSSFKVSISNIVCRLFVCHLVYDYVSYSKRFVPEAVNYLLSVLMLATTSDNSHFSAVKQLNLNVPETKKILHITSSLENWEPTKFCDLFFNHDCFKKNDTSKIFSLIYFVISLLYKFAQLYKTLPVFSELFRPAFNLETFLSVNNYPILLVEEIQKLQNFLTNEKSSLTFLTFPNKKPKLRKMFTPKFDDQIGMKKSSGTSEKINLHKQLSKKIRKEEKGVIREIRRDTEFEARERLKSIIDADNERKRKVKELYAELANQEGEYKKLTKKK